MVLLIIIKMPFTNHNVNDTINSIMNNNNLLYDIDIHPSQDIDIFDVIDLRLKHRRDVTRPSTDELACLAVSLKTHPVNQEGQNVDERFMSELNTLQYSKFSSVLDADTIFLIDLNEVMVFRHPPPRDIPDRIFLVGYVTAGEQRWLREKQFYESFPSYNELKRRNAVQIVTHNGMMPGSAMSLLTESYEKLDQQLKPSTNIIILTSDTGVLKDGHFTNERGRKVQMVAPGKVLASGRGINFWSYFQ